MDRNEFAKRLQSFVVPEDISVDELNTKVLPISEALIALMPNSLFRYRTCTNLQIEAFENDKIYAVTADLFNDPFDTLVRFDINQIKTAAKTILSSDSISQLKHYLEQGNDFPESINQILPSENLEYYKEKVLTADIKEMELSIEEYKNQILMLIDFCFPLLTNFSKKFVTIACFCETVRSITMWSHYANNHQGFVLEYNMRPTFIAVH